jgi:hypothetical protein
LDGFKFKSSQYEQATLDLARQEEGRQQNSVQSSKAAAELTALKTALKQVETEKYSLDEEKMTFDSRLHSVDRERRCLEKERDALKV